VVKERTSREDYRIELSNGKKRVLSYQELVSMLNKDDEDDVERWTFNEIKGHRWSKDKNRKGKVDVLISWEGNVLLLFLYFWFISNDISIIVNIATPSLLLC